MERLVQPPLPIRIVPTSAYQGTELLFITSSIVQISFTDLNLYLDLNQNPLVNWIEKAPTLVKRFSMGMEADSAQRYIYLFGGRGPNNIQYTDIHKYDTVSNNWAVLPAAVLSTGNTMRSTKISDDVVWLLATDCTCLQSFDIPTETVGTVLSVTGIPSCK